MSKMFFIFLACVMVLGIGVSAYGNQLSPSAINSSERIRDSIESLNYNTRNEQVEFKMQDGTPYTSGR